ncbi:MAG: hypothetical protein IJA52_05955 [Clostridia bacterium]|nr:hypothetical protein [Clostridia bacterium]
MDTGYLKKVGIYILSFLLSVGILFYFGYHIWHSFTKEVVTQPALQVTYEEKIEAEGYIFRTETVLENAVSSTGSIIPSAAQGEHIRKGGAVAALYSDYSPDTVARIAEIEEQMAMLSKYKDMQSVSLKDTASIDAEIFSVMSEMRGYADSGNAKDAVNLRSALVAAVGEKAVLMGNYTNIDSEISALESEKAELTRQLGSLIRTVYTPVSGFYYSETDGYENVFRSELLEEITLADLSALLEKEPEERGTAGKTVTVSRWYLVCMIDPSEKNTYKVGGDCSVNFKSADIKINMKVENILYDDSKTAVVLSSTRMPEGFDFRRVQDVELTKAEYTGLKVPASAVRMINGETGVYVLDVVTVRFRAVEIIYSTDASYIVKIPEPIDEDGEEAEEEAKTIGLRLHDNIITEGKGLYEGRVIGD